MDPATVEAEAAGTWPPCRGEELWKCLETPWKANSYKPGFWALGTAMRLFQRESDLFICSLVIDFIRLSKGPGAKNI